ncbi:hypothetical protein [Butyrivibrio sp. X503]|uniref:hypothetical protein n=1 Tax=Butyrivibrio sp. X503 TaxID=2364878 RepID=UPI0018F553F5|nr:hypothetical protein [Butyrivibrio sp. X503]
MVTGQDTIISDAIDYVKELFAGNSDDHKLFNTEHNMNARSFMEQKDLASETYKL